MLSLYTRFLDRAGKKYGRLTAIRIDEEKTKAVDAKKRQGAFWVCECECGNTVTVRGNLLGKQSNSCGCLQKEQARSGLSRRTHGKSHSRIATIWYHMNGRCYNPNDYNYHLYGAKGITVCDEWRNDFETFEKWALLNGYKENLSIDRVNVEGNYEPSNCRWAGFDVQLNNKRDTLWIEYQGK